MYEWNSMGTIIMWQVNTLQCDSEVCVVGLSPDSSRLVGGCENGSVRVWDLSEARLLLMLRLVAAQL